jgi:hypothetical protein
MKTLKLNNTIVRVKDKDVDKFLSIGYKYVPKSEWKNNVRDIKKTVVVDDDEVENKKTKKSKKQ